MGSCTYEGVLLNVSMKIDWNTIVLNSNKNVKTKKLQYKNVASIFQIKDFKERLVILDIR